MGKKSQAERRGRKQALKVMEQKNEGMLPEEMDKVSKTYVGGYGKDIEKPDEIK